MVSVWRHRGLKGGDCQEKGHKICHHYVLLCLYVLSWRRGEKLCLKSTFRPTTFATHLMHTTKRNSSHVFTQHTTICVASLRSWRRRGRWLQRPISAPVEMQQSWKKPSRQKVLKNLKCSLGSFGACVNMSRLCNVSLLGVWHAGLCCKNFNTLCWLSCIITSNSVIVCRRQSHSSLSIGRHSEVLN